MSFLIPIFSLTKELEKSLKLKFARAHELSVLALTSCRARSNFEVSICNSFCVLRNASALLILKPTNLLFSQWMVLTFPKLHSFRTKISESCHLVWHYSLPQAFILLVRTLTKFYFFYSVVYQCVCPPFLCFLRQPRSCSFFDNKFEFIISTKFCIMFSHSYCCFLNE